MKRRFEQFRVRKKCCEANEMEVEGLRWLRQNFFKLHVFATNLNEATKRCQEDQRSVEKFFCNNDKTSRKGVLP